MEKHFLNIGAVGDICPGDKSIMGIGVLNKTNKRGVDFPFGKICDRLGRFDLLIGNFEGVLSAEVTGIAPKSLTFCGHPDFGAALNNVGFDVLSLANNHTMEHGVVVLQETIQTLKNAGIQICGLRSQSPEFYSEPVIVSRKGKTIGILGYNWIGTKRFADADNYISQVHDSIVNYSWHRNSENDNRLRGIAKNRNKNVINDIKVLKQKVDFVILMPHWGYEYVNYPPYGVTLEAKTFIDAGVDLILGSHPHVIHGRERYKNKLIFYSLGNFIFDARQKDLKYSMLLDVSWDLKHQEAYCLDPLYINSDFQPQLANGKQKNHIEKVIEESNKKIANASNSEIHELEDDAIYKQYEDYYRKRKIKTIFDHFVAVKEDRRVVLIIFKKICNLVNLIFSRLKGEKLRW